MDTAALRDLLLGSLSTDADNRRRAELQLKQVCEALPCPARATKDHGRVECFAASSHSLVFCPFAFIFLHIMSFYRSHRLFIHGCACQTWTYGGLKPGRKGDGFGFASLSSRYLPLLQPPKKKPTARATPQGRPLHFNLLF